MEKSLSKFLPNDSINNKQEKKFTQLHNSNSIYTQTYAEKYPPEKIEEHLNKCEPIRKIKEECWMKILHLVGLPCNTLITKLNDIFSNKPTLDEDISVRDALIKSDIWGILSEEQGRIIMKSYNETKSNEIHFQGVGSGHEVLSFKKMDIFEDGQIPSIRAFDRNYMDSVINFLPYYNKIEKRNLNYKIPDSEKNNKDGSKKRVLLVLFNPSPDMEKDLITGLIKNLDYYTSVLIIGDILTGNCIKSNLIYNLEKCKYKFTNFYHEPGIHYNDFNWNLEFSQLRTEYGLENHNISQMLLINTLIVDETDINSDVILFNKLQMKNTQKEIIFLIIYNIHVLEKYGIYYYLNNCELELLNSFIVKEEFNFPSKLLKRYFYNIRERKNDYLSYLCFIYGSLPHLFTNIYGANNLLTIRSDMHVKKAIFYVILSKFTKYIDSVNSQIKDPRERLSLMYKHCNVCYAKPTIECSKHCSTGYCSEVCRNFDIQTLNHKETCYYLRPLEFYFENDVTILVFHWNIIIKEGKLKELIIKRYIDNVKKPLVKKVNQFKFVINDETIKDDLTIQDCKDMHDGKIKVQLLLFKKKVSTR